MAEPTDDLEEFYSALKDGMPVRDFIPRYRQTIEFVHRAGMTNDSRLARGRLKRLRDEVAPVMRYVRAHADPMDEVLFEFGSSYPDCQLFQVDKTIREIEVTVGQARERLYTMRELNEMGEGRGYLGLSDDKTEAAFVEAMRQPRKGSTTEEIVCCVSDALAVCIQNKSRHRGDVLLIEMTNLQILPDEQWARSASSLRPVVQRAQFSEIYLTGRSHDDICLRLK